MSANVLSKEELDAYNRDGFVVPKFKLTGADLEKLQRLTPQLVADNPHISGGIGSPHLLGASNLQKVKTQEGWIDIALQPQILDMMEQIMGPDVILWASTLFYKPPLKGPATAWHRDGAYYPIKPLATTSVWIAVTESVRENACLRVIPGSHHEQKLGDHGTGHWSTMDNYEGLRRNEFDESKAVDVELQPGQMVIFDVYTIHGSWPNEGSKSRAGYSLRFFPATSHYDHSASDDEFKVAGGVRGRELILARGRDRAGNVFGRVEAA